jgi:hypothetical protein
MARDEALNTHNAIPMTEVNSQVYVRKMEAQVIYFDKDGKHCGG